MTAPLPLARAALSGGVALAGGRLRTGGAVVLAYHDVGDDPATSTLYSVTPGQLRAHLTAARRWGLQFVDLGDLTDRVRRGEPTDGLAAVVFDDGLVGVHHHALRILAELEVPATVFVVTDALGSSPPWWQEAARVMTAAELHDVAAAGLRLGSHSRTHPRLPTIDDRSLMAEVNDSKHLVEDLTGDALDVFAYPFGDYDPRVRDAVVEAGYRAAYNFRNGRLVAGMDPYRLPRLVMGSWQGRARLAFDLARGPAAWPEAQPEAHLGE